MDRTKRKNLMHRVRAMALSLLPINIRRSRPRAGLSEKRGPGKPRSLLRSSLWVILIGFWSSFAFNRTLAEEPSGQSFSAKVTGVQSGDSLVVQEGEKTHLIRLYGISGPKKKERFYKKAKEYLEEVSFGKRVQVEIIAFSKGAKKYAIVRLGSKILNQEMVQQGLATVQEEACVLPICQELKKAQQEARARRKGIWGTGETKLP